MRRRLAERSDDDSVPLLRFPTHVGDRHALGLTDDDCLLHLDDEEELRLLEVSEQAGGGMPIEVVHGESRNRTIAQALVG